MDGWIPLSPEVQGKEKHNTLKEEPHGLDRIKNLKLRSEDKH